MEARKPTVLSPHGEGYCRHCRFVVGLDAKGRLDVHCRSALGFAPMPCKGSGGRPAVHAPYASRKSQFRVRINLGTCPACQRRIEVGAGGTLLRHTLAPWIEEACAGSGRHAREHRGE